MKIVKKVKICQKGKNDQLIEEEAEQFIEEPFTKKNCQTNEYFQVSYLWSTTYNLARTANILYSLGINMVSELRKMIKCTI